MKESAADRKATPVATGVLDYFPDAIKEIAKLSQIGNDQHNPGSPLHWDRSKSGDESDALMRHFLDRGTLDDDGVRHSAKVAWRALALLQKEIEESQIDKLMESEATKFSEVLTDCCDNCQTTTGQLTHSFSRSKGGRNLCTDCREREQQQEHIKANIIPKTAFPVNFPTPRTSTAHREAQQEEMDRNSRIKEDSAECLERKLLEANEKWKNKHL